MSEAPTAIETQHPASVQHLQQPRSSFADIPVVDFSLSRTDRATYNNQLRVALEQVGFVVFINVPGFENEFQRNVFARAKCLFDKPSSWKEALGMQRSYALRGYFRADNIPGSHQVRRGFGRILLNLFRADHTLVGTRGRIPLRTRLASTRRR